MKNNLEKVYQDDIHPLMERINLVCKQTKMPMFATFQDAKGSFRTSCLNSEESEFDKMKMHFFLHETWSFDEFMKKVIIDAKENGHDSYFLSAMGIKKEP
jgi:hypothetical protein